MLCFKLHQNRTIDEEFDFYRVEVVVLGVRELQKLVQPKNIFPNIIEGWDLYLYTLFVRGGITFHTKSGGLMGFIDV